MAACFGSLVMIVLGIYLYTTSEYGDLNLVCRHNLQSAELTVLVDGRTAFSDQISGTVKKRFGFLDKKVEGSVSKSISIPLGKHTVRVSLKSTPERFEQTKQIMINLVSGKEATVAITAQRGDLSLAYQGAPVLADKEVHSFWSGSLWSVLVTAISSVGSAAIGFLVQEFLRTRKAALLRIRGTDSQFE